MAWKSETAKTQILLTKSDTADLASIPRAIWVVTAGDVKWDDAAANNRQHTHTYTLEAGIYPIGMKRLYSTGTTAVVLGLYE